MNPQVSTGWEGLSRHTVRQVRGRQTGLLLVQDVAASVVQVQ